jgi:hypothetical protein
MATKPSRHDALTGREVVRIEIGHSGSNPPGCE